jgi:hypothetical protein
MGLGRKEPSSPRVSSVSIGSLCGLRRPARASRMRFLGARREVTESPGTCAIVSIVLGIGCLAVWAPRDQSRCGLGASFEQPVLTVCFGRNELLLPGYRTRRTSRIPRQRSERARCSLRRQKSLVLIARQLQPRDPPYRSASRWRSCVPPPDNPQSCSWCGLAPSAWRVGAFGDAVKENTIVRGG